jgi:hypothetical protein
VKEQNILAFESPEGVESEPHSLSFFPLMVILVLSMHEMLHFHKQHLSTMYNTINLYKFQRSLLLHVRQSDPFAFS